MHDCEECGEYKDDVEYIADPYDEEISGEVNMRYLCAKCQGELAADI